MGDEVDGVVHAALARYPALQAPRPLPIPGGLIHRTWRVADGQRQYVLQQLNPILSVEVHHNIEAVTSRLAERGIETPRLCRTGDGALFADLGGSGNCFRLMTAVPGHTVDRCPSPDHAASAGGFVARFHSALADLEHDFAPLGFAFHDTDGYFLQLASAIERYRAHPRHADVVALAKRLEAARAAWDPLAAIPDRVVHLDLKFNNLLLDDAGQTRCLIDLDTLSRGPLWVELGDAWRSWCNRRPEDDPEADFDAEIFEASAAAWREAVDFEFERGELESLAHGVERLALELATRFATDVLEERYFGWNPDRFESAAEHNLQRARGQLSLHDQARERRGERLQFLCG